MNFEEIFRRKKVAVTGHTGFSGAWLCLWLQSIGAEVSGLALPPPSEPNLYSLLYADGAIDSHLGDICEHAVVDRFVNDTKPEIIFHLAAQSLVSTGYSNPRDTFDTNVMGTLNVLEAARNSASTKAVVCITSDKVYKNQEWHWSYRETDELGGKDPYSASKSACEMVISTYQQALGPVANDLLIASARGGNIIGGGDWAENRIVPDFVRAYASASSLTLRNPKATRPFQHVLALVHGYLVLGERLLKGERDKVGCFNFGPSKDGERDVATLVATLARHLPGVDIRYAAGEFKESNFLHITSEKSQKELGWKPPLDFERSIEWTAKWYDHQISTPETVKAFSGDQLTAYRALLSADARGNET